MAGRGKQNTVQVEIKTEEEWSSLINREGLTVVDAYATWCGPCKAILSLFRKIRNEQQDDFLTFATADTESIGALADYRGKSEPTFLFYGGGHLIDVQRGVNGPHMVKVITRLTQRERQVVEGNVLRETYVDRVVSKEPPPAEGDEKVDEEKQVDEEQQQVVDAEEDELAKDMTRRKSAGSVLKVETVAKEMTVCVLHPDVVGSGTDICDVIKGAGYEVVRTVERVLTAEEVVEVCGGEEQLVEQMTTSPCILLAISKTGDDIGEDVVNEFMALVGPPDVNQAKEEAPESLRAKFGTDTSHNITCSTSVESACRYVEMFFPELSVPTVQQEVPVDTLQRTVAIIRPCVEGERREEVLKHIEECGFVVVMQKEITFTTEQAEQLYKHHKEDTEKFNSLTTMTTGGTSTVLCLAKSDAVEVWKKTVQEHTECEGLHASESITQYEVEVALLFPVEYVVVVLQPYVVVKGVALEIISRLKHEGFHLEMSKEHTLTHEQVPLLYKDPESEHFNDILKHMSSSPSMLLVMKGDDAIARLQQVLGPTDPQQQQQQQQQQQSIRAVYGKDAVRNGAYGSASREEFRHLMAEFFPEVEVSEQGMVVQSDVTDTTVPTEGGEEGATVAPSEAVEGGEPTPTEGGTTEDTAPHTEEGDVVVVEEGASSEPPNTEDVEPATDAPDATTDGNTDENIDGADAEVNPSIEAAEEATEGGEPMATTGEGVDETVGEAAVEEAADPLPADGVDVGGGGAEGSDVAAEPAADA